jgi:TonB family protein
VQPAPASHSDGAAADAPQPPSSARRPSRAARDRSTPHDSGISIHLAAVCASKARCGLKLTIDDKGSVTEAVVGNSSGFERLDEAAISWVKAKWRYMPAMQGTKAVASMSTQSWSSACSRSRAQTVRRALRTIVKT